MLGLQDQHYLLYLCRGCVFDSSIARSLLLRAGPLGQTPAVLAGGRGRKTKGEEKKKNKSCWVLYPNAGKSPTDHQWAAME